MQSAEISQELWAKLASAADRAAIDAVTAYMRSRMRHTFTGQPVRGFFCRIMPPTHLLPAAYWQRIGVPATELLGIVLQGAATREQL